MEYTIHVYESDQGGYMYDIYEASPDEATEPADGGLCTTTLRSALAMAADAAHDLARKQGMARRAD